MTFPTPSVASGSLVDMTFTAYGENLTFFFFFLAPTKHLFALNPSEKSLDVWIKIMQNEVSYYLFQISFL